MGSFILNYSDSRVKEANNMLEEFKKNVKYFAIKKSNILYKNIILHRLIIYKNVHIKY